MRKAVLVISIVFVVLLLLPIGAALTLESRWFSGYLSDRLSARFGRVISWENDLGINWSLHPDITVEGLRVANVHWAPNKHMVQVQGVTVQVGLPQLLSGILALEDVKLVQPTVHLTRSAKHGANWAPFIPRKKQEKAPMLQPWFGDIRIDSGRLTYRAPADETDIAITANTGASASGERTLHMHGSGSVRGYPVELQLTGDPPRQIIADIADNPSAETKNAESYALQGQLQWQNHQLHLEGSFDPLTLPTGLDIGFTLKGPNAGELAGLFGYSTRPVPYRLQGQLIREDSSWYLRNIDAQMNGSDLAGDIRWDTRPERLTVWATLRSQHLDLSDFSTGESSKYMRNSYGSAGEELLPDASFSHQQLQAFDARVQYDGRRIQAGPLPLDELSLALHLEDGVLKIKPITFGIGRGNVQLELAVDAAALPAKGRAEIEVNRLNLKQVLQSLEVANQSRGFIGGRGQAWFTGNSMDEILASLDGELSLIMTDGTLDALWVEAAGLDLGEALMTLFGEEPDPVEVKCAYMTMKANEGRVDVQPLLIATSDSNLVGRGDINLRKGKFEIVIESHPKDFSLLTLSSPVRVHGSFANPQVDVVSPELLGQGLLVAIGAAVFPPAALLGLAEAGDADPRAGCRSLVASSDLQINEAD